MNPKKIAEKLREILNKADIENDGIVNRKKSIQHENEIEVLLEHVSLLVADLRFDAYASRNELFSIRQLLEE